jgi:hypothetical protein
MMSTAANLPSVVKPSFIKPVGERTKLSSRTCPESCTQYNGSPKLASHLIKNLSVPLGTLVRKKVRLKLAATIKVLLHHF